MNSMAKKDTNTLSDINFKKKSSSKPKKVKKEPKIIEDLVTINLGE